MMRNWSDIFKILAAGAAVGGVVIGIVIGAPSTIVVGIASGALLWFLGNVCDVLAEVQDYYAAANKARKAQAAKAAKARAGTVSADR